VTAVLVNLPRTRATGKWTEDQKRGAALALPTAIDQPEEDKNQQGKIKRGKCHKKQTGK
jgi:hypothetical protein